MIYEIYIQSFKHGILCVFIGILTWALTILILGLMSYGVYYFADSAYRPLSRTNGYIISKTFSPAYTTTTMVMSGKVMVPVINHIPDSWSVKIETEYGTDSIGVSNLFYSGVVKGDKVSVMYCKGRISDSFYIKEIL